MQEWILLVQKNPLLHYIFQTANLNPPHKPAVFYTKSLFAVPLTFLQ